MQMNAFSDVVKRQEYVKALCLLCRQSAVVEQYYLLIQEGEIPDEEVFSYHLKLLAYAKTQFLKCKGELGFQDGLSFMDDANFCGFRFEKGCLSGDCNKLPDIALAWTEELKEDTHFRYEVGVLLLSHYFMQLGEYEYSENTLLKSKEHIPFHKRLKGFVCTLAERFCRYFNLQVN